MAPNVNKLSPYNDGRRRRMVMESLTAVAIIPRDTGRGANPEAHMTFFKSAEKQGRKRPGETDAEFRARMRREEAEKQERESEDRRRRRRRDDDAQKQRRPGETDEEYRARMRREASKQDGPREGETFEAFLARMREEDSGMTRARARRMFDGDMEKVGGDLVDLVTSVNEGHQHGVSVTFYDDKVNFFTSYAGEDRDSTHDHQMVRNDDGSYSILENFGHSHADIPADQIMNIIGQRMLEKEAAGEALPVEGPLADLLAKAKESGGSVGKGETDMPEANKELDALKAQVATLTAVAALTGVQKTHFDALDDVAKEAFLKMEDAAKAGAIDAAKKAAEDADPVVYKSAGGQEFRKSDDPRLVDMAKSMDEQAKENIRLQKAAEDTALTKRAEEDLEFFPGEVEVRKSILKAVDAIGDEAVRTAAHDALKAKNASMAPAFTTVGAGGTPAVKGNSQAEAEAELDRLAKEQASKDSTDFFTAYEKVSDANPELLKKAMG